MRFKIFTILIIFLFLTPIRTVFAVNPVAIPFGGPILMTYECGCSGGWFILNFDYKTKLPIPMTFQFGASMLRANYNIFTPSVQTMGTFVPGGICLLASLDCAGFTTWGTITPYPLAGIGTGAI